MAAGLDISAEASWPYFDYFTMPGEHCAELGSMGVRAEHVAICMLSDSLPPELRRQAAQLLTHTAAERKAACEYTGGGISRSTAQGRVDAMARLCMYELEWQRSN